MLPDSVNPETPDEIITMIKFSGSPWLQEQLSSLGSVTRQNVLVLSVSVKYVLSTYLCYLYY
jgi:hypothetical protein